MDMSNNNPAETVPVPTPAASAPEVAAVPVPAVTAIPEVAATPAVVAVPVVKGELPKTTGSTPGGWNRFAGYNRNDAANKKRDGRGSSQGRR